MSDDAIRLRRDRPEDYERLVNEVELGAVVHHWSTPDADLDADLVAVQEIADSSALASLLGEVNERLARQARLPPHLLDEARRGGGGDGEALEALRGAVVERRDALQSAVEARAFLEQRIERCPLPVAVGAKKGARCAPSIRVPARWAAILILSAVTPAPAWRQVEPPPRPALK